MIPVLQPGFFVTTLVANVPPVKVWVRREYLRDLRDGHGEYTPGYWVTCKSLTWSCSYTFETYLTEYGALYDKLPISAFLVLGFQPPGKTSRSPTPDLELTDLQFWNGFDTGLTVIEKNLIYNMEFQVMTRSAGDNDGRPTYLRLTTIIHIGTNLTFILRSFLMSTNPITLWLCHNGQIGAYPKQSLSHG
jgi:hypothetical protein